MDSHESEHYVAFELEEGIQNNVSHEEICVPDDECELQENITEVTVGEVGQDIGDGSVAVQIIGENSDEGEEQETYIYIKKEASQPFTSGDESMAVEALRQLGGMYSCEEKKVPCKTCNDNFALNELAKHQSACSMSVKHRCTFCGDRFERTTDLNNHMVCHQVDRPHACRTCGNLFKSKVKLQAHMSAVHQVERPHKCTVCGADFQRPSSLSNHMKIHSYVAGRALMQANPVIANVETVKADSDEVDDDDDDGPVVTSIQTIENFDLPQCGQWTAVQISTNQGNIEGLAIQSDKIDALQEFTVLPNGEVAQLAEYTTHDSAEDANSSNEMETTYVKVGAPGSKGHTCTICGVSFARQVSLTMHLKSHPKTDYASPVECEYCDKQFQDATSLATHQNACKKKLMKNSNEKWGKHACSDCGKKFTTKQKMFRHQWIHRRKTFSCEVCGSQFEKQFQLDKHRLTSHPAGSPFTCAECGKSFVSRQGLWEHGRTHMGSPAHFHCDVCSKTFSSRQGYLIHHRTHTGERPYGCKYCWKAFRDGGTLRKHERIHTGERPHVCPLCQKSFNQKVVLREHIRWVHAAGKNEPEFKGPPFPCPLCEILTQDREELCAHIVKHSDQMIAEAKAKVISEAAKAKEKPPPKKKAKAAEKKQTKGQSKTKTAKILKKKPAAEGVRVVTAEEQEEALLSITEELDPSSEPQDTYFFVNNEYNNQMCIKAYAKLSDVTQLEGPSGSINVISIGKPSKGKGKKKTVKPIKKEINEDAVHLIPVDTDSGETVYIADKQNNTLHLISKQNENSPVLAIPNPENAENYSNEILHANEEMAMELQESDASRPPSAPLGQEQTDAVHVENITIEPVAFIKQSNSDNEQMENENDNEDESEELICGICGQEFNYKNVLMEHVKIHI